MEQFNLQILSCVSDSDNVDIQKHWREVLEAEILRRCKRGQQNQVVDLMRDVSYSHG